MITVIATSVGGMPALCGTVQSTMSTSYLLWWIGQASSSDGVADVKGMIFARIWRVASSVDEKCVGVPSSDIDDWDEGEVEVPGYARARAAYGEKDY